MAVSDRILSKSMILALKSSREARDEADRSLRNLHREPPGVKVCAAHMSMSDMMEAQLSYIKSIGTGVEVLMESAITVLDERANRRGFMTTLTVANVIILLISVLVQIASLGTK